MTSSRVLEVVAALKYLRLYIRRSILEVITVFRLNVIKISGILYILDNEIL
jgi:hypothetical protein